MPKVGRCANRRPPPTSALRTSRLRLRETWRLIEEAIREHRYLYLHYLSERGEKTERLVQPLSLIGSAGTGILNAHCLMRDARRYFRLDRILDIDVVERFE